jgi:hypothetical protein
MHTITVLGEQYHKKEKARHSRPLYSIPNPGIIDQDIPELLLHLFRILNQM